MLTDKTIGVLMGGTSAERDVSLRSGNAISAALRSLGYAVVDIDAGADLCRVLTEEKIEIAFLALHGGKGENGSVQGMLEVMGIPYTGSGVLASALAMDKVSSKKIFAYHGVPVPPYCVRDQRSGEEVPPIEFPLPWVVKPSAEGSSIGVSIVRQRHDFEAAVERASVFGSQVIVEEYIDGKEIQIGILNGRAIGGVEVRPSREFYSYEAKYTAGVTDYILPPEIDRAVYERAEEVALLAHRAIGCRGATRVDLRIDGGGHPFVLEVNTIPGMTETSLLPKIARLAGFDFPGLIEEILRGVLREGE